MNISDEIGSESDLIGENNVEPSELGGSSTQAFHALVGDNETSVSTLQAQQPSYACINEQIQITNGKYFYVQRSNK